MDPLSAVVVAAATLQFLGVGLTALSTCRRIRDSEHLVTERNRELEQNIRTIKGIQEDLKKLPQGGGLRVVNDVANKCAATTDELLAVLQEVRGVGKQRGVMKNTFNALRQRRTIEKIENTLKERQKVLDAVLIQDTWSRRNMHTIEQSKELAALQDKQPNIQSLVDHIVQLHRSSRADLARITEGVQSSRADIASITEDVQSMELHRQRDKFLNSLFDGVLDERTAHLDGQAAPKTCEWIFKMDKSWKGKRWSDFGQWLREGSSIYWVCGKAGSGKSTLLRYLVGHTQTTEGLQHWSQDRQLLVLSFFFWRAGSNRLLQNSTIGLLRSLLYQLCEGEPAAIASILADLSIQVDRIPTWTEQRLVSAITAAVAANKQRCLCLFIDGLDEYTGNYGDLLDLILRLQSLDHVKCCVSSRPEVALSKTLGTYDQLLLQDLNYSDILELVIQKLRKTELSKVMREQMVKDIAVRAEGMILWASLVTSSVEKGVVAADEDEELWNRIASAPRNLDSLFKYMLDRIDESHRVSLVFYLQCMKIYEGPGMQEFRGTGFLHSICVLTAAKMDDEITSYDSFVKLCQKTETQIVARSAGLLCAMPIPIIEPYSQREWQKGDKRFTIGDAELEESQSLSEGRKPSSSGHKPSLRKRCSGSEPLPPVILYERRGMTWIHRSAYDFVFQTGITALVDDRRLDDSETYNRIWRGAVKYLMVAPSCRPPRNKEDWWTWTQTRISRLISSQLNSSYNTATTTSEALDSFYKLSEQLDPDEFVIHGYDPTFVPLYLDGYSCSGTIHFWFECL